MIIECPECGAKNAVDKPLQPGKKYRCGKCGARITFLQAVDTQGEVATDRSARSFTNTSGQGSLAVIPEEIKGWNWGAFLLNWIWAIDNKVWIGLLSLIPYAGIIMDFILLVYGTEWAWQKKRWDSIEHFKKVQKTYRNCGFILYGLGLLIWLCVAVF